MKHLVLLLITAAVAPASALGTTINVTTTADTYASDGLCSLREAVNAANFNEVTDACPAGSTADVINVPAGSILLLGNTLDLTSNLVVNGAGPSATVVDGGGDRRVFKVWMGSNIEINGIRVTGGRAPNGSSTGQSGGNGGGIENAGNLTLRNSVVSDSAAGTGMVGAVGMIPGPMVGGPGGSGGDGGGIYSTGTLTLVNSTITGNQAGDGGGGGPGVGGPGGSGGSGGDGAGIYVTGNLTVTNTTIADNRAGAGGNGGAGAPTGVGGTGGAGGGIASAGGFVAIDRSTIARNRAGTGAGGAFAGARGGPGGGLAVEGGTLSLMNTTLAQNATGDGGPGAPGMLQGSPGFGGGLAMAGAGLHVTHATISGNSVGSGPSPAGGGIFLAASSATATLAKAVVAGNSPENCHLMGASLADGGHNLSFPDATCPGMAADPRLGSLQGNGGPTATMALGAGSAALDFVPAAAGCLPIDQRGIARPQGRACDSGAFEFVPPPVALDVTAPISTLILKRQLLGAAMRKGYVARFTTNEPGKAVLELFTNIRTRPTARIVRMRVAVGTKTVAAPGQYKIVAKFTRKAKKRFARANKLVVSVRLIVSDAAGNKTVKTKRVTLRR